MIKYRVLLFFARICSALGYSSNAAWLIKSAIAVHPRPDYQAYRRAAEYLRLNGEFDRASDFDIRKVDAKRIEQLVKPERVKEYLELCRSHDLSASRESQVTEGVDRRSGHHADSGPEILCLTARQSEKAGVSVVNVSLRVFDEVAVEAVWLRFGDEWIYGGEFEARSSNRAGIHEYEKCIRCDELASQMSTVISPGRDHDDGKASAHRFHCYVQLTSTKESVPNAAVEVETLEGGKSRYRYPMGKAWLTEEAGFTPSRQVVGELVPYINKGRYLSFAVGPCLPSPSLAIHNDGLTVTDGHIRVSGRVFSRYASLAGARLVLLGRTSGFRREANAEWQFRDAYSRRLGGKKSYLFSSEYDFSNDVNSITDDVVDLYLEMDDELSGEVVRKRIGKTSYRAQRKSKPGITKSNSKVLSIVPYYTYLARNPALQLEVFDTNVHDYFLAQLRRTAKFFKGNKRPVWLIGEMRYRAQDNGLHFFRYMRDNHPEIDAYYVIEHDSPEKHNLSGYDHVIDFRSKEHVDIALIADALIGTHSVHHILPTIDPRLNRKIKAKRVFLQHGVIAQKWMEPVYGIKNKSGFYADQVMVSSAREKEFIVHDLGFSERQVSITGLSRFDSLFDGKVATNKKQVFIMPTWRPWLQDRQTFEESDYFNQWMGLLAGDGLRGLAKKYELELVFCLHPNMRQYSHLFHHSGARVVSQGEVNVQQLIKESALLLTDLSSVAMDFAFLHKPVVYFQFDANRFPKPHADPFTEFPGPVLNSAASVIEALESALSNNGKMANEYQKRADKFVAYRDTNNSSRIFQAIKEPVYKLPLRERLVENDLVNKVYKKWRKHSSYLPFMQKVYYLMRWLPMDSNTIVFESNVSRSFGDSPLAIYNELIRKKDSRKKIIVCNKPVRHYDNNTRVVKRHSPEFMYYMARAKYWVNSQQFPFYLRRRKKGVFVQTWHGTPLKRMMFDQENHHGRDHSFVDRTVQSVAQWSVLVSPNRHTSNVMRSAFRFTGPIKEIGYPRNDILASDGKAKVSEKVRQQFGLDDQKFVVLYAPTFRDDKPTRPGRFRFIFDWPFEPEEWVNALDDDVVLLVRAHNLISNKLSVPGELAHRIIDVTDHPDVQELFLASDMLITDYSSAFFDYAILKRPILFYAYDLQNYRENLRGFYLDYGKELPGPIVTDKDSLFKKVREYSDPAMRPAESISPAFIERFAPYDDGHASERVIDQLLGGLQ